MAITQLLSIETCVCGHSTEAHELSPWGDCAACTTCRKPRSSAPSWIRIARDAFRRGSDAGSVGEPCEHSLRPCYDCSSQRSGW